MSKELSLFLIFLAVYIPLLIAVFRSQDGLEKELVLTKPVGETFTCTFCRKPLAIIHDFGKVALAGGFLKPDKFEEEKKYPLRLCYCPNCHAVQLADRVSPDVMFRDYFYFSSANETIRAHFREYAADLVVRFMPKTAIEVGCNDGVLTEPLRKFKVKVTGVDPSSTVPKGPGFINDYFTPEVARKIGKVDVVIANNVFAHITDIHTVTKAVTESMKDDGVFVMEAHYLGDMIEGLQYDWIYHEHVYYYSLLSLENHFSNYGLRVFDVRPVKTHGGSMRYYICKDNRGESPEVQNLRDKEKRQGFDRWSTYQEFSSDIDLHRERLRSVVGESVLVGYGASGRANALIQYCGLKMAYIVDDAPAKQGYFTPGSHVPIYGRDRLDIDRPDRVMVFAWGYMDEIRSKCDLPLLIPFPEIKTVQNKAAA